MKRILSIMLAAIFIVSILTVLPVPSTAVTAVEAGKGAVYTSITSVNGVVYFAFNLTGQVWTGSQVDLILSPNGYATFDPDKDLVIKTGIDIIRGGDYVDAIVGKITLTYGIVNKFLNLTDNQALKNESSITLYLKITDYSNFIATNSFTLLLKSSGYVSLIGNKFSYIPNEDLGSINWFNFTVNLADLDVNLSAYDVVQVLAAEKTGAYTHLVFNYTDGSSDVLANISSFTNETYIEVNGTLKDFDLGAVSGNMSWMGVNLSYFEGSLQVNAMEYNIGNLSGLIAEISDGNPVSYKTYTPYTVNATVLSITGVDYTPTAPAVNYFKIFPSLEFITANPSLAGPVPGQVNPGDNVTIAGHNFVAGEQLTMVYLYYISDDNFVLLKSINITNWNQTVDPYGNFSVTITLPEAPYGGREIFAGVETNVSTFGIPASIGKVYPYIDVFVADEFGEFQVASEVAPGDYVLVKGHGFLSGKAVEVNESITDTTLPVLAGSNVANETGQFAFIGRMTYEGKLNNGTLFDFYVSADVVSANFTLRTDGALAKIYINPEPFVNETTGEGIVYIYNDTVVPYGAYEYNASIGTEENDPAKVSDDEPIDITLDDVIIETIEVIGIPKSITSRNITIGGYILVFNASFTNGYFRAENVYSPGNATFGDYVVEVEGTGYNTSTNNLYIKIRPGAALMNLDREPSYYYSVIYVALPNDNVSIVGFGFNSSDDLGIEIWNPDGVLVYTEIVPSVNITDGFFKWIIKLDLAHGFDPDFGGIYVLRLYQNTTKGIVNVTLLIYFAAKPTITIKAYVGHAHVPGEETFVFVSFDVSVGGRRDPKLLALYEKTVDITLFYYDGTEWKNTTYTFPHEVIESMTPVGGKEEQWYPFEVMIPESAQGEVVIYIHATAYNIYNATLKGETEQMLGPISVMHRLEKKLDDLRANLTDLQITVSEMNATLVDLITEMASGLTLADLKTTMTGIEATILAKINDSTVTIIDKLGTLEATITGDVAEVKTSLGTLQTSVDDLKSALTDLINSKAAQITTSIDEAKGAIITQITDSEGRIIAKITELGTSLSGSIDSAKSDIISQIGSAKSDILGQLSSTESSLNNNINAAKKAAEEAGSTATMFGAASTILVIIVLGLLAYSIYMRKK